MEWIVAAWLYGWGAVATSAFLTTCNLLHDNVRSRLGVFALAVMWPIYVPGAVARRIIRVITGMTARYRLTMPPRR